MRKKILFVSILMLLIASMSAIYVEVGTGTTNTSYVPVYGFYNYSWSRTIYLQSDLINEMEINALSYNVGNTPNNYTFSNQTYYMRHTTASSIPSTDFVNPVTDPSFQLVYSGSVTYDGGGWNDLILTTAFDYNGTDNLEVVCHNNMGQWVSGYPNFVGTVETPGRAIYKYIDASFPEMPGTISTTYPNTRFHFTAEGEPSMATLTAPTNGSFNVQSPAELTWTNGADTDWVRVYFSDNADHVASMNAAALVADNYTQQSYTTNDLNTLTNYFWKIVSGNDSQYLVPSPMWSFTSAAADGAILIGNGIELNTGLPMEPYWHYSMSQTIYNQEWINADNQRIEQISYNFNGYSAWTEDIKIYMAHTNLNTFDTTTSWVLENELTLVFDGQITTTTQAGWITLLLDTPFNYNNTDNLLVAMEANTPGCFNSNDDFFGSLVDGNKSIRQYSDSVNSDFVSPVAGTLSNKIPNTLFTMGDIPTTPQLLVFPDSYTWDDTIMNTTAVPKTFTLRNTGLGTLSVNSVTLAENANFSLTDTNTYPLSLTDNSATFSVAFHPQSVGNLSANIIINDNVVGNTVVTLSGNGYDAMISDFPHFEGFEGVANEQLPQDWASVVTATNTFARVGATTVNPYEGTQSLKFYNSSDTNPTLIAITPPVNNLSTRRIRFMARSSSATSGSLMIGTTVNNVGDIEFEPLQTVALTTTYQQFQQGFTDVDDDAQFIALKFDPSNTSSITLYVDNISIESIPAGPAVVITQTDLDFGDVYLNRTGVATLNIENWGIEDLEVDFSQTGTELSFAPEELTITPSNAGQLMVQLTPIAEGVYTGSFTVNTNDPNLPTVTINTTANILPALPEGIVVIGSGTLTNQGLPLEPFYRHSYSQTIYYAGEIGITGQQLEKISWHYNGNTAWGPDDIKIYLGMTTETSFASNTSWISADDMMEVYDGTITVPANDGFVEIMLDTPFGYDNSQNLVVAVFHTAPSWHGSSDEFYCTGATETRSLVYNNDSTIPNHEAPPTATFMRSSYPNVKFEFGAVPDGPAIRVSPLALNFGDVYLNRTGVAQVNIRNIGSEDLEVDFTSTGTTLSFAPDELTVEPLESSQVMVTLTPAAEGAYNGSFVVNSNDSDTPTITITTTANILPALPEGLVVIGDGTLTNQGLPFEPWYRHSYSQSIYYASEIGLSDQQLETISWHYNGNTAWGPDELKIYMGLTTETSFASNTSWIIGDDMMEVFTGTITVPNTDGYVEIMLDTPFNYTNTQNLVVGVFHSAASYHSSSDEFYCTPTTETRSILFYGDSTIPDPASPPTAGYMRNNYPNVHLQFGEVPEGPAIRVSPLALDFGDVYLNRTGMLPISIRNIGTEDLTGDFSITGTTLSLAPDEFTIEPFEFVQVMVSLNPEVEGAYAGSFVVNSNDPLHPTTTVTATANILPALPEGLVIIGNGTLTNQGLPFEPWYRHSYSQSIYTSSEIGLSDQRVEKISWHYNGSSAWGPDQLKIFMGLTSETTFSTSTSWINAEDMMEVYDGTITVPSTDGLVEIILDIPFNYSASENLVVGVFHTADSYHSGSDEFYCTPTTGTKSILYYSDSTIPTHEAPPAANYMRSAYPNVHLQFGEVPDAPDLTVYPHNTTYEMVPVNGSSMEKTFTMRSIGLQDITIPSAPTLGGTNADQFSITTDNNTYPIVLPLGELATVGVTFSPTSEGTKSATLIVTGGGDRRETYTVNLNGYAYADDGNDQPAGATVLTLPVEGDTYAIMPIGDVDWYQIPAMGIGDTLMAHTTMAGGSNINTKLWLYGPVTDPADIAGTAFVTSGTNITHVLPASGNYYLRVAQTNVNPSRSNPHTRKNFNGETERDLRDDTGLYNLFVSANYNYDYNAPVNFEASNQSGFVELTWEEPDYERYLIGYNVYRDGSVITPTMIPIGTNTYNDAEVVVGVEYTYYAVGMYEDPNGFSLPSNSITLTYFNSGEPLWGDDFEDHRDFILDMPNWIQYDVDGGDTYGISNVEFENAGAPMSYIVFNPAATTPPITDMIPQSGNKFIASFASSEGENNDWIITPRITIGATTVVSFYARSYTSDYGLEKFKVKMSLGGDQVENFTYTLHQGQTHLEAPTEWTPFHFNVSQLAGNTARFAIQCISTNAFILMIDNFRIDSTDDGSDNDDVVIVPQVNALSQNYPNPFNPETSISFSMQDAGKVSLDIYNIKGQKVKTLLNDHREAGTHNIVWNGTDDNNKNVSSGIYFYRMKNGKFSSTKKMILTEVTSLINN